MSDKIKKFSEAIRLGASFRGQTFGGLFTQDGDGTVSRTCAIGAALEALGEPLKEFINQESCWDSPWQPLAERFGLCEKFVCPTCKATEANLLRGIAHLNDTHTYTREAIADWLEKKGL